MGNILTPTVGQENTIRQLRFTNKRLEERNRDTIQNHKQQKEELTKKLTKKLTAEIGEEFKEEYRLGIITLQTEIRNLKKRLSDRYRDKASEDRARVARVKNALSKIDTIVNQFGR